jgi:hypothetical protein
LAPLFGLLPVEEEAERNVDQQDLEYWDRRAESELRLAQNAASPELARPHYRIAISYLERAEELKRRLRRCEA